MLWFVGRFVAQNVRMNRHNGEIDNAKYESDQISDRVWGFGDGDTDIAYVRNAYVRTAECNGNPGYRVRPAVYRMPYGFAADHG